MIFGTTRNKYAHRRNFFVRHSLSIVLFLILFAQSAAYYFLLQSRYRSELRRYGEQYTSSGFWNEYLAEWTVSTLAEVFGFLLFVQVTKKFYEDKSPEAKDPPDE